jgi:hypothetical protein
VEVDLEVASHRWATLGPQKRLATGRRPRRCSRSQTEVSEDLLDHRLLQDRRNDLQLAAAVRAVLLVDVKDVLEQPRSFHQLTCSNLPVASDG